MEASIAREISVHSKKSQVIEASFVIQKRRKLGAESGELRGFDQDGAQSGKVVGRESTVEQVSLYAAVASF